MEFEKLKINDNFGINLKNFQLINYEKNKIYNPMKRENSPYLYYPCAIKYNNKKLFFVHHIIAYNYLYNSSIPPFYQIHHINNNSLDNSLENLQFINPSEHHAEHIKNRVKRYKKNSLKLINIEPSIIKEYEGITIGKHEEKYYRKFKHGWKEIELKKIIKNNMTKPAFSYILNGKYHGVKFLDSLFY